MRVATSEHVPDDLQTIETQWSLGRLTRALAWIDYVEHEVDKHRPDPPDSSSPDSTT